MRTHTPLFFMQWKENIILKVSCKNELKVNMDFKKMVHVYD